jgi:cell fate regulator YaaT (PSP1 superfamily)
MEELTLNNGGSNPGVKGFKGNTLQQLPVVDWLADLPETLLDTDLVEVQFKNTRKGYYHNINNLPLEKGVKVVVEANPGVDLGEVVLTGRLVPVQIKKNRINTERYEIRNILRVATDEDLARAAEAHKKEQDTMIKSRQLAKSLGLEMKIGDVEYQGDGSKAIFYYIAEGRVDFRQLIKVYAETFRIRIEMKQIGARQEAGRIGGTGPCGRELCCSTWMTQFSSVGTNAARIQNISLNPQKLAGQCAKLKCCLNYEVPVYEEAVKKIPSRNVPLETKDATYYFFSSDPLAGEVTYSTDQRYPANLETISPAKAREIIDMNRRGEKPLTLGGKQSAVPVVEVDYQNVVGQDDLTRFDKKKNQNNNRNNGGNRGNRNRDHRNNGGRSNEKGSAPRGN